MVIYDGRRDLKYNHDRLEADRVISDRFDGSVEIPVDMSGHYKRIDQLFGNEVYGSREVRRAFNDEMGHSYDEFIVELNGDLNLGGLDEVDREKGFLYGFRQGKDIFLVLRARENVEGLSVEPAPEEYSEIFDTGISFDRSSEVWRAIEECLEGDVEMEHTRF